MVTATRQNSKTITRRLNGLEILNENPDDWQFEWFDYCLKKPYRFTQKSTVSPETLKDRTFNQEAISCPYGSVGDILWVRETFCYCQPYGPESLRYKYIADDSWSDEEVNPDISYKIYEYAKKRPSIHMPREACREFLQITSIRVERLQKISKQDAIDEGIELHKLYPEHGYRNYWLTNKNRKLTPISMQALSLDPINSFLSLWSTLNPKNDWPKNPWVWVITFRRVRRPDIFLH